jgi:5,10-methylenetetrahydrofolate reductase
VSPRLHRELDVSLEITPPASPKPGVLLRRAQVLGGPPSRIHVIQRSDRWSSLDASMVLRAHGFDPVWHLANRGRVLADIEDDVARAGGEGIHRVLCLRGEHKATDDVDTPKIREVVRIVRRALAGAHVTVTLNHHLRRDRVLPNLWGKLEAGASAVQTQIAFDLEALQPFAAAVKYRYPHVAVAPMLMPVTSPEAARRIAHRLSIPVPRALVAALAREGEDAGWRYFAGLLAAIDASSLYDGVAIMTPIDPTPDFARRLRESFVPPADTRWP